MFALGECVHDGFGVQHVVGHAVRAGVMTQNPAARLGLEPAVVADVIHMFVGQEQEVEVAARNAKLFEGLLERRQATVEAAVDQADPVGAAHKEDPGCRLAFVIPRQSHRNAGKWAGLMADDRLFHCGSSSIALRRQERVIP